MVVKKRMNPNSRNIFIEIVSGFFILLFLYTAVSKLFELEDFQRVLYRSPVIQDKAVLVSWFVIVSEIVVSALLLSKRFNKAGLLSSVILMSLFTGYILYLMLSGLDLPCRCGGVIKDMTWGQHVVFNWVFIVAGIAALMMGRKEYKYSDSNFYSNKPPVGGQAGVAEQL